MMNKLRLLLKKLLFFAFLSSWGFLHAQDCDNHVFDQSDYFILNTTNNDFLFEFEGGEAVSNIINIGDLNGDGFEDIIVLAHKYGDNQKGAIFTCFLDEENHIIEYYKINSNYGNLGYDLPDIARFGSSGDVIGDYNGDGVNDIVVSSYGDDADGSYTGALYILCMNTCGQVKESYRIGYENNDILPAGILSENRAFGVSVKSMGDMDNDGVIDLAVGVQNYDSYLTETYEGAIAILFLNNEGGVKNYSIISSDYQDLDIELGENYRFGASLQNIGDLDGNGVNDLAVGATLADDICYKCGTNYILFLDAGGNVLRSHRLDELDELIHSNDLATKLNVLEDQNDNGIKELLVGSLVSSDQSVEGGQVYMLYLNAEGKADSVVTLFTSYVPQELSRTFNGPHLVNNAFIIGSTNYKVEGLPTGALICFAACESASAIQEIPDKNNALILEPNPSQLGNRVDIIMKDKNILIESFEVCDQLGNKVPFKLIDNGLSMSLELYNHAEGIYVVSFRTKDEQIISKKLIIQ